MDVLGFMDEYIDLFECCEDVLVRPLPGTPPDEQGSQEEERNKQIISFHVTDQGVSLRPGAKESHAGSSNHQVFRTPNLTKVSYEILFLENFFYFS